MSNKCDTVPTGISGLTSGQTKFNLSWEIKLLPSWSICWKCIPKENVHPHGSALHSNTNSNPTTRHSKKWKNIMIKSTKWNFLSVYIIWIIECNSRQRPIWEYCCHIIIINVAFMPSEHRHNWKWKQEKITTSIWRTILLSEPLSHMFQRTIPETTPHSFNSKIPSQMSSLGPKVSEL